MYFELDKASSSYYIDYEKETPYSISAAPIETDDPLELAASVLAEFSHSTPEEKALFRPILEAWLLGADEREFIFSEEHLLSKKAEEVLHWVYEMF
ncbi:MAG: hypothetical protein H6573_22870 [Lewinellaceae bacterium]|nr:hypothetical protein [Lewinellaceae bacterium]